MLTHITCPRVMWLDAGFCYQIERRTPGRARRGVTERHCSFFTTELTEEKRRATEDDYFLGELRTPR